MSWSRSMRARLGAREWLVPEWPAPGRVRAFVTTRAGGVSEGAYASMNLGMSSGDDPQRVARNREIVREVLPETPRWLAQVHGTDVFDLDRDDEGQPKADAAISRRRNRVCAVLTADCMPLLLCDVRGSAVAVAHAGWRGLAAGVVENAVRSLGARSEDVIAWLGPTIGPGAFEVGPEVREAFVAHSPRAESAFVSHKPGKYTADLYALARQRLEALGVGGVFGGEFCTYQDTQRFFSYRREKQSGRMGTFIWME
jgi:polyphenol oxidase